MRAPHRRHRALLAALAAAAVVVAGAVLTAVVDRPDTPATGVVGPPERTVDPYPAGRPCPDSLPDATDTTRLPDLDRVTSVRLCAASDVQPYVVTPLPTAPQDRLVAGVASFTSTLAALDPPADDPCAYVDVVTTGREALQLVLDDGTARTVSTTPCVALVTVDGHQVDGGAALAAFLDALDRQRSVFAYSRAPRTVAPTCLDGGTTAPVRPARDAVVSAVLCPSYGDPAGEPRTLDGPALDTLRGAWARTPEPEDEEFVGQDDEAAFVLVRTDLGDLGDLVRLPPVDGRLLLDTRRTGFGPSPTAVVPVGVDDLG